MASLPPGEKGSEQPPSGSQPPRKRSWRVTVLWLVIWTAVIGLMVALSLSSTKTTPQPKNVSYATFLKDVGQGQVASVEINQSTGSISGNFKNDKTFTTQGPTGSLPQSDLSLLNEHHVARAYVAPSSNVWGSVLLFAVPLVLIAGLWIWMGRRAKGQQAGLTGWSKSRAKVHITERPSTTFADIAGYDGVKQEIGEVVEFLKNPKRFEAIGARIPKGMLLVGPPGTGKTLFARAIAGEAGVPFINITGSEFMEMFVGVGAARVRDLFATARQHKPAIIFVDEIDAIGRKRGTGLGGGHDEREQTLNQLLSEMDGFEAEESIVVLAATNRPDILDPALLRAGRFDRQVVVPLPTLEERRAILEVHSRGKHIAADLDLDTVARGTPGMSGADLENLVNEAALIAVRHGDPEVSRVDMEAARDRVLLGLRRTSFALSEEEKHIVSFHEAGHTLLAHLLPHADPVHKVNILPTGMALGATQQLPAEEHMLEQRPYLDDTLAVRLGGRQAEELVFGLASTGAQDDFTSATELAGRMVREWGMSERLAHISWAPRGPVFLGEDLMHTRDYSDETARVIDEEIARILDEQAARARQILEEHRPALEALASALFARESLDGDEVAAIVAQAEGAPHTPAQPGTEAAPSLTLVPDSAPPGTDLKGAAQPALPTSARPMARCVARRVP